MRGRLERDIAPENLAEELSARLGRAAAPAFVGDAMSDSAGSSNGVAETTGVVHAEANDPRD